MLEEPYNAIGWPIFPDVHKFSDEELGEWVRGHAETLYHPVRLSPPLVSRWD